MATPKKANSKNNPTSRSQIKQARVVSSVECERCKTPCKNYERYIELLNLGKLGYGVKCSL